MKKPLIILCFLVRAFSSDAQYGKIDSFFKAKLDSKQLNGQVLIAQNNKILYNVSGGYADFATEKPNNPGSKFNLASISKIFTSVAILQLKERGKVKLDDHIVKYLPKFPFTEITVRQLLSHTSGLPDIEIYGYLVDLNHDTIVTNKDVLSALKKWDKGLLFKPGENYRYSNPGYSVLALLVEKLSGMNFGDYLHKYIFIPAKMNNTYLILPTKASMSNPTDTSIVKLNVQSTWYQRDYGSIDSAGQYRYFIYNCAGTYGEKNIIGTAEDLLNFDAALFGGKLLTNSTLQEAFTPIRLNNGKIWYADHMDTMEGDGTATYGLGFEIFDQPLFGRSVGHGGYMGGLATFYFHNIEKKQTIIAYQNTSGRQFGNIVTASLYLMNRQTPFQIKLQESIARIYGYTMKEKGIDEATVVFNELRSDTLNYYLSEQEINWLGGDLLYFGKFENHKELGLEVLKVNSLLFPLSFNVYDSYGDALAQNGKIQDAIRMYKKSLLLNSNNEGGKEALKYLLQK